MDGDGGVGAVSGGQGVNKQEGRAGTIRDEHSA
jgi:hypothetical protein